MNVREERDLKVLSCVEASRAATYVIRNRVAMRRGVNMDTPAVLRALKRLERAGRVERAPACYLTMIEWRMTVGEINARSGAGVAKN